MPCDLHFDPATRTLRIGGERVDLVGRELDAFEYLYRHAGHTVSRSTLERDVWQMREGAQSETVPVTVRKVRAKLGPTAGSWITTVRGVGWRFTLPVVGAALPRFGTPFHPRQGDVAAVHALAASGWRVVTLVGAGGVGKTRLVAECARTWPTPVVFAAVGAVQSVEDGLRVLGEAAGLMSVEAPVLEASIAARGAWMVLDEAELAFDVVRSLIMTLSQTRFLVTSRRGLDLPDEAIHGVEPLPQADAVAFLQGRLAASRWNAPPDAALLARAVDLLDRLPLAMELAAHHPDLVSLLAALERLELPAGPEGTKLQATLAASLQRLSAPTFEVLCAMCLCEGTLSEDELVDWHGADVVALVRDLASRSLILRQDRGWSVLRTTRVAVRSAEAPWADLQSSLDAWLVRWATQHARAIPATPRRAVEALRRRFDDLTAALGRLEGSDLAEVAAAMVMAQQISGHQAACGATLRLALRRAPDNLRLQVAMMLRGGIVDARLLDRADADADLVTQAVSLRVRAFALPDTIDLEVLDALVAKLERPADRVPLLLVRCQQRFRSDPSVVDTVAQLAAQHDGEALLAFDIHRVLAEMRRSLGQREHARHSIDRCVALAKQEGMAHLEQNAQLARALLWWEDDPEACARLLLDTASRGEQLGMPTWLHRGLAGIVRYSQGALEESASLLATLEDGMLPPSVVCRAFLQALRLRRGEPGPLAEIEALTSLPSGLLLHADQTPAEPDLLAYLQGEARLFRARRSGREAEAFQGLLQERRGDRDAGRCRLVRDLYADWSSRAAAVAGAPDTDREA